MQKRTLQRLLRVAKGEEPPDKVIINGKIVNVFTNSIEEDRRNLGQGRLYHRRGRKAEA